MKDLVIIHSILFTNRVFSYDRLIRVGRLSLIGHNYEENLNIKCDVGLN